MLLQQYHLAHGPGTHHHNVAARFIGIKREYQERITDLNLVLLTKNI